jgi:inner membrane protein
MDNLTHTLTGLMLSRAGLNRWYPRAGLVLLLSANVPDIDIVASLRGSLYYFEHHRGISHSVLIAPVMALLPVLVACAVGRTMRGWLAAWGLAIIGVASHLLLDWTNAYGVRLLMPFSSQWLRLDLNDIVDLWIWAVLLLAWAGPMLGRLVSSEMGAKSGTGRGLAIFALSFVLIYDGGRALSHQRAVEILNSRVYHGGPPIRAAAFPRSAVNPFSWSGWVERPGFAMHFQLDILDQFDPDAGMIIYKPDPNPAIEAARRASPVEVFLKFAQFPLWQVLPVANPEGGYNVQVRDWRFPFNASATVDASNHVLSSSFGF